MNFKRANTKFDELYEIRLATPNDIDNIMAFLKAYWDKNHILAVNRDFFEYEFRVGDRVNYILAVNRQTGKIDACEGIYIYSKGDDDTEPFDMAGGMFRTSPHALLPFLGLEILYRKRFMMGVKMRSYIGIGAKKETTYILTKKYFKDDMVGRLDHFYRLNDKKEYQIAHITHKTILDIDFRIKQNWCYLEILSICMKYLIMNLLKNIIPTNRRGISTSDILIILYLHISFMD